MTTPATSATPQTRIKPKSITDLSMKSLKDWQGYALPAMAGVLAVMALWFLIFGLGNTAGGDPTLMIPFMVIVIGVGLGYLTYKHGKAEDVDWPQTFGIFLVLCALSWVFWLYVPSFRPFITTPEGRLHLGAYFVLSVIAAVAIGFAKGWKRWMVIFALFLTFWVMGNESNKLTGGRLLAEITGGMFGRGGVARDVHTVPEMCDQVKRTVNFKTNEWTNINRGGTCNPSGFWHDGHCLVFRRADWTNDRGEYLVCAGGRSPKDVEWAKSADVPFVGAVALGPPSYN